MELIGCVRNIIIIRHDVVMRVFLILMMCWRFLKMLMNENKTSKCEDKRDFEMGGWSERRGVLRLLLMMMMMKRTFSETWVSFIVH